MPLFQNRSQKGKTGPVWGFIVLERGKYKEKVQEGGYGGDIMYSCMKMAMRPVETILVMRGRGIKENDGRGEFNYDIL
jgi:hypothetical protein